MELQRRKYYRQQQFWINDAEFNNSKMPFELGFFIKFLGINFIFFIEIFYNFLSF